MKVKVDDEVLLGSIPLSFAMPICWEALHSQMWGLFFMGLLVGVTGLITIIDSNFHENRLIIRLIGTQKEEAEDLNWTPNKKVNEI